MQTLNTFCTSSNKVRKYWQEEEEEEEGQESSIKVKKLVSLYFTPKKKSLFLYICGDDKWRVGSGPCPPRFHKLACS